jgi:hypothetical protein
VTEQQQHPITPPPELVCEWLGEFFGCAVSEGLSGSDHFLATRAAQWGANMELEACCEWLGSGGYAGTGFTLRAARRPKPPNLKEQALEALQNMDQFPNEHDYSIIRRALEQLPDD